MSSVIHMHAIVKGCVQGVGFRATAQHYAKKLNLKGSVKNLEDGTVEINAQGDKLSLEEFVNILKADKGPGKIDLFITDYYEPKKDYPDFSILF